MAGAGGYFLGEMLINQQTKALDLTIKSTRNDMVQGFWTNVTNSLAIMS